MSINGFEIEEIKHIIVSYLTDVITEEERERLDQWLKQESDNLEFFNEMVTSWRLSGTVDKGSEHDLDEYWDRLEAGINTGQSFTDSKRDRRILVYRILGVAASVAIVFLLGGYAGYLLTDSDKTVTSSHMCEVTTPNGTRSELLLPDGSRVWLNAGSTLVYPGEFKGDTREVELVGEAFFQVKTNKEKPFVVKSSGLQIKALGTTFNVKAYPGDKELAATLVEGRIVIEGKSKEKGRFEYTLAPRQSMVFVTDTGTGISEALAREEPIVTGLTHNETFKPEINSVKLAENVNTELYTSWKDKRWVIEQESLTDLLVQLERRYNVEIICKPEELSGYSFSGTIENETFEQVMHILQLSAPLKYEFGKGEVLLKIDTGRVKQFKMLRR